MKRLFLAVLPCLMAVSHVRAQADHPLDEKTLQNDSAILKQQILPVVKAGQSRGEEPDWSALRTAIVTRYDASYGDRNITKAQIYYFYGRDWARFSAAVVQYTNTYDYRDNGPLMNANAKMILEHSQDREEWKAAQRWVKRAMDREPNEPKYKATYDALTAKINK